MKNLKRVVTLSLVLATILTVFCTTAFAANSKSGTNLTATVVTGKKTLLILNPTIVVRNTGSTQMFVHCEDSRGALKQVRIDPGKTSTISLKPNQEYFVYFSGNPFYGYNARGTISAGRSIQTIY